MSLRKSLIVVFLLMTVSIGYGQSQFLLVFDDYQLVEDPDTSLQNQMRFPIMSSVVVMGGLNDLDGMGNYFNVFGSKLLIDSKKPIKNGEHALILRREDGRNFYDLFPTLSAKLIPVTHQTND